MNNHFPYSLTHDLRKWPYLTFDPIFKYEKKRKISIKNKLFI